MKKVVLLAPYFLPRRRVGSWRPFKFAIHLKQFGWEPHIVTIHDSSGTLTEKERRLLAGIPVHSIKPPFDFTQQSGSSMEKSKSSKEGRGAPGFFDPFLSWIDKNFPVDTWLPLFLLRKSNIQKTIRAINPDVLWSTGDPWSGHWLADKIAKKQKMPWVADFRDPWTLGGVSLKNRSRFSSGVDKKAERRVVENASVLTFTSQATEKLYQNYYADLDPQTQTVYNCYDLTLYDAQSTSAVSVDKEYLNVFFFGKFRRLSPARPLMDILTVLADEYEPGNLPVRVHSFGEMAEEEKEYAARKGILQYFVTQPPVPAEQALSVLSQADILWLSTDPDRVNIIPAKLWDYLAAQRPVLSVAPNPEIAEILERTEAGLQIDHTKTGELAGLLKQSIFAKQQGKSLPIPAVFNETIKEYEATQITARLAAIFDQLV